MKNLDFTYELKRQLAMMNVFHQSDMLPTLSRRPKISKTYKPNGRRECARRIRQMARVRGDA